MKAEESKLKKEILEKVKAYYEETRKDLPEDIVPVSGKVYDQDELINLVESSLKGWWTDGEYVDKFEEKLSGFLGVKHAAACNSGSSANLLAFASLTSPLIDEEKRVKPGDEVIAVAAGFPTTVNPIILYGCIPVFVDIELGTYNVDARKLSGAVTEKTKAVFLAHTLGNPFDLKEVMKVARENDLWVIEDNCDSLGSRYGGRYTGTFGHLSTQSFYPAHHITSAEGGAVLTRDPLLDKIVRSMRDWGRDCWCKTGRDNTCGRRFDGKYGDLPQGYDHKYVYSHIGYNLKMTDLQAAIGLAQMDKLHGFIRKRKENYEYLYEEIREHASRLILPQATEESEPSWFGFPVSVKGKMRREDLTGFLEKKGISTRLLFGGNLTKQPYFRDYDIKYRTVGGLENTDYVMEKTFWTGIYPALDVRHMDYVASAYGEFYKKNALVDYA